MIVIVKRLLSEPVYLGTVLIAAVGIGTSFGLGWSGEQVGTVTAAIAVITGAAVRQNVTPTNKT